MDRQQAQSRLDQLEKLFDKHSGIFESYGWQDGYSNSVWFSPELPVSAFSDFIGELVGLEGFDLHPEICEFLDLKDKAYINGVSDVLKDILVQIEDILVCEIDKLCLIVEK